MEAWELAHRIRKENGINSVWDCKEYLTLGESGTPALVMYYQLSMEDDWIKEVYAYQGGSWIIQYNQVM